MSRATPWWDRAAYADRRNFLLARAKIAAAIRAWFAGQGFLEVEPSALVPSPGAETHIEAFAAAGRYLHTSPEFAMKKLLAAGEEKLVFFGKCWRRGETGPLHAEEFTMVEWYRANAPYARVMEDCAALARIAADSAGAERFRWRDRTCDPHAAPQRLSVRDAFARLADSSADLAPDHFSAMLVSKVEPHLGLDALTFLDEYPIREAALAQRCARDPSVAERFELYACGVELANGFGELTDPIEQRARLEAAMAEKEARYGVRWPIDEDFLAALATMAPASGCALGFDRLVMLATHARHINDVLWTPPC